MKRSISFVFFAIAVSLCAMTSAVQAQVTRTWVSGTGDDANPCSRTLPCKTFAGAISKTNAGGEIDALDPGGFGTLTITKAITIDGGGGIVASVLASATPGITVNAGGSDSITLRNLQIQGTGSGTTGISFIAGLNLNIENCSISNFTNLGIDFEPAVRAFMTIRNSVIEGNANGGLVNATTAQSGLNRASIVDTTFKDNGNIGIRAGNFSRTQLTRVFMSSNGTGQSATSYALEASTTSAVIDVESSIVTNSRQNGVHASGGIIQMSNSSVTLNNGNGLTFDGGGQLLSFGQNRVAANVVDGSFSGTLPLH